MSASAPCPPDHPLMIAWNAYKATEDYANNRKWATHSEHVEGSLWGAFMAGFIAQSGAISDGANRRNCEWLTPDRARLVELLRVTQSAPRTRALLAPLFQQIDDLRRAFAEVTK